MTEQQITYFLQEHDDNGNPKWFMFDGFMELNPAFVKPKTQEELAAIKANEQRFSDLMNKAKELTTAISEELKENKT